MSLNSSRWRKVASDTLFVIGTVALATLIANGSLLWAVSVVSIAVIAFISSHLLWPWQARFAQRPPLVSPPDRVRDE
jgi:membrane protein implicated in regulation of membrane protease activity